MNAYETVPATWTSSDEEFFGIVARIFSTAFTAGASVLLASNDIDTEPFLVPATESRELVPVPAVVHTS